MARKNNNHNTQASPIMALAVFALFAMMVPLITIANGNNQAKVSSAATPSPTPEVGFEEFMIEE